MTVNMNPYLPATEGVQATSGISVNYYQPFGQSIFDRFLGTPIRVAVPEKDAKHLRKGGYFDYDGTVWKIVRILKPLDWSKEYVVLHLKCSRNEGLSMFKTPMKVSWLEDEYLPGLQKAHAKALDTMLVYGGRG